MKRLTLILAVCAATLQFSCSNAQKNEEMFDHKNNPYYSRTDTKTLHVTDAEWKKVLPKEVYNIARLRGTEYAFTGKYYKTDTKGMYYCAACGNPLFRSDAKFSSTCGWPSFMKR